LEGVQEGAQTEEVLVWIEPVTRAWFGQFVFAIQAFGLSRLQDHSMLAIASR